MSRETLSLSEQYINKTFASESAELARVRERLKTDGKFGINVGAGEGKLLSFLVALVKPKLIVEIGTLYGYSTQWMAEALPVGGRIVTVEFSPENHAAAKSIAAESRFADRIEFVHADAKEFLQSYTDRPDLVFIDADKAGYRHYLDWAMEAVNVGGVIIGDNTFLFGHMIGEDRGERAGEQAIASMKYFNETLASAENFRSAMIPTFEGMTVAVRLR